MKDITSFAALDFETANYARTSACAIGLAVVEKGKVTDTFYSLIKPVPGWFLPDFTGIHGITAEDVEDAPTFKDVWPAVHKLIRNRPLLAHNAPFDRGVLRACLEHYRIPFRRPDFLCSLRLARAAFPRASTNKLSAVCRRLRIPLDHHHAGSDALACARAALKMHASGTSLCEGRLSGGAW